METSTDPFLVERTRLGRLASVSSGPNGGRKEAGTVIVGSNVQTPLTLPVLRETLTKLTGFETGGSGLEEPAMLGAIATGPGPSYSGGS